MTRLSRRPLQVSRRDGAIPALDPAALAIVAATAYVEIRTGRRPVQQLDGLATRTVLRRLQALVCRTRGRLSPGGCVSVCRAIPCRVADHVAEVAVVLRHADRHSAVAVRLERRADRWWVTALSAPEDRPAITRRGTS